MKTLARVSIPFRNTILLLQRCYSAQMISFLHILALLSVVRGYGGYGAYKAYGPTRRSAFEAAR